MQEIREGLSEKAFEPANINRPQNDEVAPASDLEDQSSRPSSLKSEPPDGGWIAWSQVLMGHLANIMVWGYANAFGVFQLYYKQTTDWPAAQISWIGSIQLFLMFIMGTVSGRLADAGLARHCIFGGSVLCVFGVFMTSVSTQYWQLILTQGVCTGIGGGLMAMPTATIIGSDFKKKRALAMSISACGTGVGAMVYTAALQYLIPQIGFQWAVRACGLISLFLATIANALARPRLPPRKSASFVDWTFFKDRPFVIFTAGSFLIYYSLFTVVIYVSISPMAPWYPQHLGRH